MSAIDTLIGKMTLAEKLGQLTMTASSYAVTGPVIAGDSAQAIKDGTIGNLLNMVGAGSGSREGSGGRRHCHGIRPDARCGSGPSMGAQCGRARRGSVAGRPHRRIEGAWVSGIG